MPMLAATAVVPASRTPVIAALVIKVLRRFMSGFAFLRSTSCSTGGNGGHGRNRSSNEREAVG
jgi:hypothetical protein